MDDNGKVSRKVVEADTALASDVGVGLEMETRVTTAPQSTWKYLPALVRGRMMTWLLKREVRSVSSEHRDGGNGIVTVREERTLLRIEQS